MVHRDKYFSILRAEVLRFIFAEFLMNMGVLIPMFERICGVHLHPADRIHTKRNHTRPVIFFYSCFVDVKQKGNRSIFIDRFGDRHQTMQLIFVGIRVSSDMFMNRHQYYSLYPFLLAGKTYICKNCLPNHSFNLGFFMCLSKSLDVFFEKLSSMTCSRSIPI